MRPLPYIPGMPGFARVTEDAETESYHGEVLRLVVLYSDGAAVLADFDGTELLFERLEYVLTYDEQTA